MKPTSTLLEQRDIIRESLTRLQDTYYSFRVIPKENVSEVTALRLEEIGLKMRRCYKLMEDELKSLNASIAYQNQSKQRLKSATA